MTLTSATMPKPKIITTKKGIKLNYIDAGSGPVIIQAAAPGHEGTTFAQEFVPVLSPYFRTIAFDARGAGESERAEYYSYKAAAADAIDLLDTLGVDKAYVYGSSGGGIEALTIGINYQDRIKGVICDSSSAEVNEAAAVNWRKFAENALLAGVGSPSAIPQPKDFKPAFAGNKAMGTVKWTKPDGKPTGYPINPNNDPRGQFAFFWGIADLYQYPLTAALQAMTPKLLVMIGDDDNMVGVGGSVRLNRAVKGSRLKIYPGVGHTALRLRPDLAVPDIRQFINDVESGAF